MVNGAAVPSGGTALDGPSRVRADRTPVLFDHFERVRRPGRVDVYACKTRILLLFNTNVRKYDFHKNRLVSGRFYFSIHTGIVLLT